MQWSSLVGQLFTLCVILLFGVGCNDFENLERNVRAAAPPKKWNEWAAKICEQCREITNAHGTFNELPSSQLPEFVRRIPAPCTQWKLGVVCGESPSNTYVGVATIGGFGSYGFDVGTRAYVGEENYKSKKVFPGVYVRRSD